jgi:hypothetical protein
MEDGKGYPEIGTGLGLASFGREVLPPGRCPQGTVMFRLRPEGSERAEA